jgi:hypothetical protein
MFCTVVCSVETACAVSLIAVTTALKFAFTSAAFAGVPATNVLGIVIVGGGAPKDDRATVIASTVTTTVNFGLRIFL